NDQGIGYMGKEDCHLGNGVLHRAFSFFIFNDNNELLIQRRSAIQRMRIIFFRLHGNLKSL
ncbi:MAG: hypothetical protein KGJ58_03455, partial [Patescibacteria group bacterium]|nr:hypothetical protein [Patescibacteria group bacterium]